jgi:hypothetical protein
VGRDNHPRERQARKLARKKGNRPPYPRVLIVTEGQKTEPQYFDEIRRQERIPSAHVAVLNSRDGTEPIQIVKYAIRSFREQNGEFDHVFAVFDRDEHRTYRARLNACRDTTLKNDENKRIRIRAIPSNPCFELWLLLHYEDIHQLFHRDEIIDRLKRYIPGYEKAFPGTFALTSSALVDASARAKRLQERDSPENDTEGPYTNVDVVVELLLSLAPLSASR